MWIGDFVRCHSVVKLLRQRFPDRPVDLLATTLCAPLADYMPGVRQSIVADLPRGRLGVGAATRARRAAQARRLWHGADRCRAPGNRRWRRFLPAFRSAPALSAKARFVLLNDVRFGERKLPRMVDRCAMLALPRGATQPPEWPLPELKAPAQRDRRLAQPARLDRRPPDRRARPRRGRTVEALAREALCRAGAPARCRWLRASGSWAARRKSAGGRDRRRQRRRDLTGPDLRDAILALGAAVGRDLQRFRPAACRGGARHAVDRHFRADQSMALGAAQSAGRRDRDQERASLPALPQAGLPACSSSLHA